MRTAALLASLSLAACVPLGPGPDPEPRPPLRLEASVDGRDYLLISPAPDQALPLVVALHGCAQSPQDLLDISTLEALAAERGFHLAAPAQPSSANLQRCWNWFLSQHQARDRGEPASIVAVVEDARAQLNVDDARVIVVGLSAGAAMAVTLGVVYADVFSGVGAVAGLEWRAATNVSDAFTAMQSGGPDPAAQGRDAAANLPAGAAPPRVFVVHGDADDTVAPVNGEQLIAQWAKVYDLADGAEDESVDAVADAEATVEGAQLRDFHDAGGEVVLRHLVVPGMGHAWPGGAPGAFSAPDEVDAASLLLDHLLP